MGAAGILAGRCLRIAGKGNPMRRSMAKFAENSRSLLIALTCVAWLVFWMDLTEWLHSIHPMLGFIGLVPFVLVYFGYFT